MSWQCLQSYAESLSALPALLGMGTHAPNSEICSRSLSEMLSESLSLDSQTFVRLESESVAPIQCAIYGSIPVFLYCQSPAFHWLPIAVLQHCILQCAIHTAQGEWSSPWEVWWLPHLFGSLCMCACHLHGWLSPSIVSHCYRATCVHHTLQAEPSREVYCPTELAV